MGSPITIEFVTSGSLEGIDDIQLGKKVKAFDALLHELSPAAPGLILLDLLQVARTSDLAVAWEGEGAERNLVGMAMLGCVRTWSGWSGVVEDVVVAPECRGRGIGRALMEALIGKAREHKFRHINLTSRPERAAARRLYEALGFKLRDTGTFRLSLA